jgi:hypothetical protein
MEAVAVDMVGEVTAMAPTVVVEMGSGRSAEGVVVASAVVVAL